MKYEVVSKKTGNLVEVTYDDRGILSVVRFEGTPDQVAVKWMLNNIPLNENDIKFFQTAMFDINVIIEKVSHEEFWEIYNHKIGKQASEKQWGKLTMAERGKAIRNVPRYQSYCKQQNPPRKLKDPERYLSQKTFNDQFVL